MRTFSLRILLSLYWADVGWDRFREDDSFSELEREMLKPSMRHNLTHCGILNSFTTGLMSVNCHLNLQLQILTPAVLSYVKDETKLDATRVLYCYNEVEPGSDSNWSASYSD